MALRNLHGSLPRLLLPLLAALCCAGHAVAGQVYYAANRTAGEVYRLEDINGDGDALDSSENLLWASGMSQTIDLVRQGNGLLAMDVVADQIVRLEDLNGDGDALDAGESLVWADGFNNAFGLAVGAEGEIYATEYNLDQIWQLQDLNADGDALDVGEKLLYADSLDGPLSVLPRHGDMLAAAWNDDQVHRLVDGNGDGDTLDVGENLPHTPNLFDQANGMLLDPAGGYFVSSRSADTVYRVEDKNGDGDALDTGEVLSYADFVFGGLNGPWNMAGAPGGGFLLSEYSDNQIALVRDANGDGDALDLGDVAHWADVNSPTGLVAELGPGPAGSMITIQSGAGTLDAASPNFVAIVEQSTVDHAVIDAALNSGKTVLVSSNNPNSFAAGTIVQNADAPVTKTAGGAASLSVRSDDDVILGGGVTISAGTLHLLVAANDAAQTAHDNNLSVGDVTIAAAVTPTTFDISGVAVEITSSGSLGGSGTVNGPLTNNGTLSPGTSAGQVDITGTYMQGNGATLTAEFGGLTAGTQYDQVTATGTVSVDGTLAMSLINPYEPAIGHTYLLLSGSSRSGTFATTTGVVIDSTRGLAVLYNAADVTVRTSLRGDTDLDDDVDTADLTKMFQNFTGAGGSGKFWVNGDNDGDADVDTADLTIGFQNFTGALAGLADNPDLVYNPANGNVRIYADGATVGSFNLQSAGQFNPPADFSDLDADVFPFPASVATDNTANTIGWVGSGALAGFGFDGPAGTVNTPYADLGNIFPTGLDLAGLQALLTANDWAVPLNGGTPPSTSFDLVVVPEPGSLALLALGLLGLVCLRLRRMLVS